MYPVGLKQTAWSHTPHHALSLELQGRGRAGDPNCLEIMTGPLESCQKQAADWPGSTHIVTHALCISAIYLPKQEL